MHLTIGNQKVQSNIQSLNVPSTQPIQKMTSSHIASGSKQLRRQTQKKGFPTFRVIEADDGVQNKPLMSPRSKADESPTQQYRILQNMKSPYFLKKT